MLLSLRQRQILAHQPCRLPCALCPWERTAAGPCTGSCNAALFWQVNGSLNHVQ